MSKIRLRLSFAEMDDPNVSFWISQLKGSDIEVVSASQRGIDAIGTVENIERALRTKLTASRDGHFVVGKIGVTEGDERPVPVAYVPREPTYF